MYREMMEPLEEQQFWLTFGYQPEGMVYCIDCQNVHESKCQRND